MNSLAHINTLHELLALALDDLAAIEKTPGFVVDMGLWVRRINTECRVCLAGSVMVRGLGATGRSVYPSDFDEATERRLDALDDLRMGDVRPACEFVLGEAALDHCPPNRDVADYSYNRDQWWADMHQLLAELREANV